MTALLIETTRELTSRLRDESNRDKDEKPKRKMLRMLARTEASLAEMTLSAWTWVCETLEGDGFEGRELAGHCQVVLDGIDGSLAGYERLRALADESGLTPEAAG